MQRQDRRREHDHTPEIQVPFSGFTPLNASSSPPGGIYHTKDIHQEQQAEEQQSSTQRHNVHLARHLGLGTDRIPTPLATLNQDAARGRKKKTTSVQAKSESANTLDKKDSKVGINASKNGQSRGTNMGIPKELTKRKETTMHEFFSESKTKARDVLEPDDKPTECSFLTLPADNAASIKDDDWQQGSDEALVLPDDFDSDQLLSDADLEDLLNECLDQPTNAPSIEEETDHVTDSVGDMDDEELFRAFINYPPVDDDDGDEEFDGDDLPDEDMVELLDCSVGSQQRVEEVDFDDSWLDELDEAEVELLTPCSMPRRGEI